MRKPFLFASALLMGSASAQVMPSPDRTVTRESLPPETQLNRDTEYKRKFQEVSGELDRARRDAEEAKARLRSGLPAGGKETSGPTTKTVVPSGAVAPSVRKADGARSRRAAGRAWTPTGPAQGIPHEHVPGAGFVADGVPLASGLQTFATTATMDATFTVLPTGSHVRAKVVSGVEANASEPYPVLLQLDHGFTGPNRTRIDLSHCFMIAKARANLSTERVLMETENLSCVRDSGEHFKAEAKGYIAGNDSTFGATGTYISKQGQVLLAAVLANIAKNAGGAVAEAQQSQVVLGSDKAATATNLTGSKAAFVAGKSVMDAGSMIAQWYLDQARQLVPSIGIGSGQDVFVIMLDTVRVPALRTSEEFPFSHEENEQ